MNREELLEQSKDYYDSPTYVDNALLAAAKINPKYTDNETGASIQKLTNRGDSPANLSCVMLRLARAYAKVAQFVRPEDDPTNEVDVSRIFNDSNVASLFIRNKDGEAVIYENDLVTCFTAIKWAISYINGDGLRSVLVPAYAAEPHNKWLTEQFGYGKAVIWNCAVLQFDMNLEGKRYMVPFNAKYDTPIGIICGVDTVDFNLN